MNNYPPTPIFDKIQAISRRAPSEISDLLKDLEPEIYALEVAARVHREAFQRIRKAPCQYCSPTKIEF